MAVKDDIHGVKNKRTSQNKKDKKPQVSPGSEEEELPDGGWGWVVALGASIMMGMSMMVLLAFGIIYSRFLSRINSSSTTTALIYNFNGFVVNVTQLFAPPLCDVFGLRKVAVAGAILFSVGIFSSSFAKSSWHLLLSFSVLAGIGGGLNIATSFFIVPRYFKKKRGAAMAIMMSGSSVGVFGGSLLITYLQDKYGFTGGTLVLSAIFLHCLPAALSFHPASWHLSRREKSLERKIGANEPPPEKQTINDKNLSQLPEENLTSSIRLIFSKFYNSVINNFKMIKSYRAVTVALVSSLAMTGFLNFNMMVPFWLQSTGFSIEQTALCVSIGAIMNLASRIAILFASDFDFFNIRTVYPVSTIFLALSALILTFLKNRLLIFTFVSFFGSGMGLNISLFSFLIINVMGMKDYQPTFGLLGFFKAIENVTLGPLAGWIRDMVSYQASLLFIASVILSSIIIYLFLPLAIKFDKH